MDGVQQQRSVPRAETTPAHLRPNPHSLISESAWRHKLLPFMIGTLVTFSVFFLATSYWQMTKLASRIQNGPTLVVNEFPTSGNTATSRQVMNDLEFARWIVLARLETYVTTSRHHQSNTMLMFAIWTRYLGFVTGMILSLLGAAFVLGRLREPHTEIGGDSPAVRISLASSSPGLILVVLGAFLMTLTIVKQAHIQLNDQPVYIAATSMPAGFEGDAMPYDESAVSEADRRSSAGKHALKQLEPENPALDTSSYNLE
jgi:hypothetical protein